MYKPCSKFEGKFEEKKAVFLCNDGDGHPGQFVYIRDDREEQEYFGLCEVEVFQFQSEFLPRPRPRCGRKLETKGGKFNSFSSRLSTRASGLVTE